MEIWLHRPKNKSVIDLIRKAMKENDCSTENALAVKIGIERQYLSRYRKGVKPPNDKLLALCEAAKVDFAKTLAEVEADFASSEEVRNKWEQFAKNLGKAAGVFMTLSGLVMFWSAPENANAAPVLEPVTMKVTESARNALPFSKTRPNDLYYVK